MLKFWIVAGGAVLLMSCLPAEERDADPPVAMAQAGQFHDFYQIATVIRPEQSQENPIARLSGIDFAPDGRFLIGDVSQGNVKLFDPSGRLLTIFGRAGDGPGEFRAPRYPRFGPDGKIHIADAQIPRVQVFDPAGELESVISLPDLTWIQGFRIRPTGDYVILSPTADTTGILLQIDQQGAIRSRDLPIGSVLPDGQSEHPAWGSLRSFSLAVRNDTAFVSATLTDSLWTVDLNDRTVRATKLSFPGYVRPELPAEPPPNAQALFSWANTVHMASTLSVGPAGLFQPYVQGVLNYGDPMILVTQHSRGEWYALSGAPPIVHAGPGGLVAIHDPDADHLELAVFEPAE